ncbi:hypothetical protein ACMX25_22230 [Caballeronia sp. 15715]|uniref:hypothetical protein n=1 Tax=Caballeronia sp. 15715 TaxID=3391030 RepID=UPI0039E21D2B
MAKQANTFHHQDAEQTKREEQINKYLKTLSLARLKFEFRTDVATMVAAHLTMLGPGRCVASTLMRNARYRVLLEKFWQATIDRKSMPMDVNRDSLYPSSITNVLEVTNLRRENERLKLCVAGQQPALSEDKSRPGDSEEDEWKIRFEEANLKFIRTCQALHLVLSHMEVALSANPETRSVIDLSRMRNNVVVAPPLSDAFFEWLKKNEGI